MSAGDLLFEEFVLVRCEQCAMPFYMTKALLESQKKNYRHTTCPIGHSTFITTSVGTGRSGTGASESFVATRCPNCALLFYPTNALIDMRRGDHRNFWCPMGHSMSFLDTAKAPDKVVKMQTETEEKTVEDKTSTEPDVLVRERRHVGEVLPCHSDRST